MSSSINAHWWFLVPWHSVMSGIDRKSVYCPLIMGIYFDNLRIKRNLYSKLLIFMSSLYAILFYNFWKKSCCNYYVRAINWLSIYNYIFNYLMNNKLIIYLFLVLFITVWYKNNKLVIYQSKSSMQGLPWNRLICDKNMPCWMLETSMRVDISIYSR